MDENSRTLSTYDDKIEDYIDATPKIVTGDVKTWLDKSLSYLVPGCRILEIGSAFGRDSVYMQRLGFDVVASDGSKKFVNYMKNHGQNAKLLNAITDQLGGPYDMIFANAVLLHFTIEQTEKVLDKIHESLKEEGIFSFRMKKGTNNGWSSEKLDAPRFFQYWQANDLIDLIKKHNFSLIELTKGSSQLNDFKWLQIIARKS